MFFPQPRVEKIISGIVTSQRIAGAYLFVGPPGAGKKATALAFADQLECKAQDKIIVEPDGASLKIEQIRDLQQWVRFGPSASPYLLVIVSAADTLTDQAAAAFLKTLEEPAPGVVFVLLAEREDKILPTILSRCQKIIFPEPPLTWQPNAVGQNFYTEFQRLAQMTVFDLMQLSSKLSREKDSLEEILYDLAYFCRYNLSLAGQSRVILEALRFLQRKANSRLVLDNMCLKLGAAGVN